jgi:hypothetical protein
VVDADQITLESLDHGFYSANGRAAGHALAPGSRAWAFASEVAPRLPGLDPLVVVDVCETPDGLRLLELKPFSGADLYACDRTAVVDAVHRVAL